MQITKPHWTTYGLGWFQQDYRGKMLEFHTGSLDGAVAIIGLVPDEHFEFIFLKISTMRNMRHALMLKALDLWLFNDNSKDWSTDLLNLYGKRKADAKKKQKENDAKRC
jgi:hypothetical protein